MSNTPTDDILTHIEASAPCSLFSVALWADEQMSLSLAGFLVAIDALVASGTIAVTADDNGLVVDLV